MRRVVVVVSVMLLSIGLAAPAASAAAPLAWKDPAGDAHFHIVVSDGEPTVPRQTVVVPTPNEQSLDITDVTMATKGAEITWSAKIAKLAAGAPAGATGRSYVWSWEYRGAGFYVVIVDDLFWGQSTELRARPSAGPSTSVLSCSKCRGVIDVKESRVTLTMPVDSLAGGMRQATGSRLARMKAGDKLDKVTLTANRTYSAGSRQVVAFSSPRTSDEAKPPGNAAFVV